MKTLFLLIASHYVGDYALQNDFIAKFKAQYVNKVYNPMWFHILFGHSMVQGLGAYLATGSVLIGVLETAAHFVIDFSKGHEKLSFNQDQALHILCKIIWFVIARSL